MRQVSKADKMQCPLRLQCHRNRLFNPIKVDCFGAQNHSFETEATKINLYHIYPALYLKFKIQPNNKRLCRISPIKSDLTYFHSAQLSVIPQLQFRFCELHNTIHDISMFQLQFLFNVICVIKPNASCYILCSIWFAIDQARKAIHEPGNVWRLELALRPHGEPIWAWNPLDS